MARQPNSTDSWNFDYTQSLFDATAVSEAVARGESIHGEALLNALRAQRQIAEALQQQAAALVAETDALLNLHSGNFDEFLSRRDDGSQNTLHSFDSAMSWVRSVEKDGLYDSYESALAKIERNHAGFQERNVGGLVGLIGRVVSFSSLANVFHAFRSPVDERATPKESAGHRRCRPRA